MEIFSIEMQSELTSRRSAKELAEASAEAAAAGKFNKALRLRQRAAKRVKIEEYQNEGLL